MLGREKIQLLSCKINTPFSRLIYFFEQVLYIIFFFSRTVWSMIFRTDTAKYTYIFSILFFYPYAMTYRLFNGIDFFYTYCPSLPGDTPVSCKPYTVLYGIYPFGMFWIAIFKSSSLFSCSKIIYNLFHIQITFVGIA